MQAASAGALALFGLMLVVLVWSEADTLNIRFRPHCEVDGEAFLRVNEPQDTTGVSYVVIEGSPDGCVIEDSTGWATRGLLDNLPETLAETSLAANTTTGSVVIENGTWTTAPEFASSISQALLSRIPGLLFGGLTFLGMSALVAHYWYA